MKRLMTIGVLAAAVFSAESMKCHAAQWEEAINKVLDNVKSTQAEVGGHKFLVEAPTMEDKQKHRYTLVGELKRLGAAKDKGDVVAYRVIRERGAVKEISIQINGGMRLPMSEKMLQALGGYLKGGPMSDEAQLEVTRALEKAMDGTWLRAAEFLIAHIAARHC